VSRWFRRKRHGDVAEARWRELRSGIVEERRTTQDLLTGQQRFVADLEALLFRHDPIGINFGENTDEYRAEAETITLRLPEADTEDDARRIVHEEFIRWFSPDIAGPAERYIPVAHETWKLWRKGRG
jgi:hypothetical protein